MGSFSWGELLSGSLRGLYDLLRRCLVNEILYFFLQISLWQREIGCENTDIFIYCKVIISDRLVFFVINII